MDDGGLGRTIDQRGGIAAEPSGNAAIVDDAAEPCWHMRRRMLHAEHHAAHQRRHRRIEAIGLEALDAAGLRRPAGIVEQAIDTAEFVDRKARSAPSSVFDATSVWRKMQAAPSRLASASPSGTRRPAITTFRALGDEISAVRIPMPLVAPVITATFLPAVPCRLPVFSDACLDTFPACRNNASRARMDSRTAGGTVSNPVFPLADGHISDLLIGVL